MKKIAFHWWILIALVLGVLYGVVAAQLDSTDHVLAYIRPVGTLFFNLLRMIAVPLVMFSLAAGVASLNDTAKLGRIGGKTIGYYLATTAIAICIGLAVVNIIGPGQNVSPELREKLSAGFAEEAASRVERAESVSFVDQLVGIVPTNPFEALSDGAMLSIVFFSVMLGVAFTRMPDSQSAPVVQVFQSLSDGIIEMVMMIMKIAPFGVFAQMAAVVADLGRDLGQLQELFSALLGYMATVVLGLALHVFLVYGFLIKFVAKRPLGAFLRAMVPAQLLAFSSSSSAATLPVTINCVEKKVGVDHEISSFVLPMGATVNMDGTGLYQGVAAVFIATVFGMDLSLSQQLQIVLTAALASIGTAAVPGVGIVMLTIVLKQIGVPLAGIALILGVDRLLDMCRTVVNVTGDATVATVVASTENALHAPEAD
jgi:proton glutamate symport protein